MFKGFTESFKQGYNGNKPSKPSTKTVKNSVVPPAVKTLNRVERIWLASGIIGMFVTNPRTAIENKCIELNQEGYQAHQILPHNNFNILALLGQILLLVITLGLFTFTPGYMILFKKI